MAAVREKVQALPTVEQFRSLNAQAQRVAYLATQTAYDAYLALDEAQQARLEEELETIKALFSYYNTQIMPLG